jgi:ATP-dependent DNA helicase RecG
VQTTNILQTPIEYLKGVGPIKADLLKKELGIFVYEDLLNHFPYRQIDKTVITPISSLNYQMEYVQVTGKIIDVDVLGDKRAIRLVAELADNSGATIELTWFQGISWIQKNIHVGNSYLVFGRLNFFNGKPQIVHPEIEVVNQLNVSPKNYLEPVYPTTEKLKARGISCRHRLICAINRNTHATGNKTNQPCS